MPQADLIIFVFSVVNPWGASAWQFLELLQKRWLKNVIFVLQQMDLRDERRCEAVIQHLRQTAMTRFGQAFPIFPVSAKKAFLSKTSGVDKERLWTESNFAPLEDLHQRDRRHRPRCAAPSSRASARPRRSC